MNEYISTGEGRADYSQSMVDSYASASLNNDPLLYPGQHPENSFVTDGHLVSVLALKNVDGKLEVQMHTPDGTRPIDDFLREEGTATIDERIPVIGYGSNLCPGSLLKKFQKIGRPEGLIVPTLYTELSDVDVVWSAGPGMNGNFIATLYSGEEITDTKVRVGLNMLTREQLLVMHTTELNYNLRQVTMQIDGVTFPAYFYSGGAVLLNGGQPVAVQGTYAERRVLPEATTSDLLRQMLANPELRENIRARIGQGAVVPETPEEYIKYIASLKPSSVEKQPKLRLKNALQAIYADMGLARVSEIEHSKLVSWANPSTIPTFGESLRGIQHRNLYVLPQQELSQKLWNDVAARQKVLHSLGEHFIRQSGLRES